MDHQLLEIVDLQASTEEKQILKGVNLTVKPKEIHAIMGPNGAGKSTLAKVLAGHFSYQIDHGSIDLNQQSILELDPEERALMGLFVSFQYPLEVNGITNFDFLHACYQAKMKQKNQSVTVEEFKLLIESLTRKLQMKPEFLSRGLNTGFSGGEKKRNEILQMLLLNPQVAILDETDSGLDVDALKVVADGINQFLRDDNAVVLITHYQRLLDLVQPDFVHIMIDGKIVASGTKELAYHVEKYGYEALAAQGKK